MKNDDRNMIVVSQIRQRMRDMKLTQSALAHRLHRSPARVSELLRETWPRIEVFGIFVARRVIDPAADFADLDIL